jgi:hypothetical protein
VTIDGVRIAENETLQQLTAGVSIQPEPETGSSGAGAGAENITIENTVIEDMSAAGGGGPGNFTFGILSFGGPISDVTITDNQIRNIGRDEEAEQTQGVAVSLESLSGQSPGEGAVVRNNIISNISTLERLVARDRPGTGVALRPNFNGTDSAAEVADNNFSKVDIAVTHPAGDAVEIDDSERATVIASTDRERFSPRQFRMLSLRRIQVTRSRSGLERLRSPSVSLYVI